jgi:hypothetical protein
VNPRRSLGALVLVGLAATACSAGRDSETDKERGTPFIAQASTGSIAVRAVRVVLSDTATNVNASATTPQAYLTATIVNRAATSTDALTGASVAGAGVTPIGGSVASIALPPQQAVQIGDPELGFSGTALGVGALQSPLSTGTTTTVTFTFRNAGTVTIDVPVMTSSDLGTTDSTYSVTPTG